MLNFRFVIAGFTYKLKYDKERAAVEAIFESVHKLRGFRIDKKKILESFRILRDDPEFMKEIEIIKPDD